MPPLGTVIFLAGVATLEIVFVCLALRHGRRARLVRNTPLTPIDQLYSGPAKVQGRAVVLAPPLDAPLSRKPCIYYRFVVYERRTQSHGKGSSSYWKTVIDDAQHIPCGVEDSTGVAEVRLGEAQLLLTPGAEMRSGFLNTASPDLEDMLRRRYKFSTQGWVFNKTLRYTETTIEEGDALFVLGNVETVGKFPRFGKGDYPFLVATRTEAEVLSRFRGYMVLFWVLAALVIAGAVLLARVFFR
jgi:hypothetical protein